MERLMGMVGWIFSILLCGAFLFYWMPFLLLSVGFPCFAGLIFPFCGRYSSFCRLYFPFCRFSLPFCACFYACSLLFCGLHGFFAGCRRGFLPVCVCWYPTFCKIFYVFGQKSGQNIWNWVEECAIFAPAFGRGRPGGEGWRRRGGEEVGVESLSFSSSEKSLKKYAERFGGDG